MAFVLAQLSDPHLAPLPAPRARELFSKRITGYLNWRRSRAAFHQRPVLDALVADMRARSPAHIAVTGDLVNIALPDEFAAARRWLESLGNADDVTVIPGNHDAYVSGGFDAACGHWGEFMRGDGDGATHFPFVRRRGPVSLIAVSSAVTTPWFRATGLVGQKQLMQLTDILAHERDAFRIVLIHHPVRRHDAHRMKRLIDADAFLDVLRAQGAELVLHGHNHRNMHARIDGPDRPIDVVGVASASAINDGRHDPASYNLFEIDGDASRWRCRMIRRGFTGAGPGPGPGPVGEVERIALME